MIIIGWILMAASIFILCLNGFWAVTGGRTTPPSQIHLVPLILWYLAILMKGTPFFFSSIFIEFSFFFIVHLMTTLISAVKNKR